MPSHRDKAEGGTLKDYTAGEDETIDLVNLKYAKHAVHVIVPSPAPSGARLTPKNKKEMRGDPEERGDVHRQTRTKTLP